MIGDWGEPGGVGGGEGGRGLGGLASLAPLRIGEVTGDRRHTLTHTPPRTWTESNVVQPGRPPRAVRQSESA